MASLVAAADETDLGGEADALGMALTSRATSGTALCIAWAVWPIEPPIERLIELTMELTIHVELTIELTTELTTATALMVAADARVLSWPRTTPRMEDGAAMLTRTRRCLPARLRLPVFNSADTVPAIASTSPAQPKTRI